MSGGLVKRFIDARNFEDKTKANIKALPECKRFRKTKEGWRCMDCGAVMADIYKRRVCRKGV